MPHWLLYLRSYRAGEKNSHLLAGGELTYKIICFRTRTRHVPSYVTRPWGPVLVLALKQKLWVIRTSNNTVIRPRSTHNSNTSCPSTGKAANNIVGQVFLVYCIYVHCIFAIYSDCPFPAPPRSSGKSNGEFPGYGTFPGKGMVGSRAVVSSR